jgi:hypothetical protein
MYLRKKFFTIRVNRSESCKAVGLVAANNVSYKNGEQGCISGVKSLFTGVLSPTTHSYSQDSALPWSLTSSRGTKSYPQSV